MRKTGLSFVICLSIVFMAACAKPSVQPSAEEPRPDPTALVTLRVGMDADHSRGRRMDALITAFQGAYPQYRVVQVSLGIPGPDQYENTKQKLRSGELDVIQVHGDFGGLAREGAIIDLAPYIQRGNMNMAPYAAFLPFMQQEGRTYMLPYAVTPYVMLFNKGLAEAAGEVIPKLGWTWDQLREIAKQLTDEPVNPKRWGITADHMSALVFPCVDQAQRFAGRTEEQAVQECFRRLHELINLDRSMAPSATPPVVQPRTSYRISNDFGEGTAGMAYRTLPMDGGGYGFDWDWAPLPTLPGASKPVTMVATDNLALVSNSPNKETAWTFMQFVLGPEGAVAMAKAGFVPFYQSDEARDAFRSSPSAFPEGTGALLDTAWVSHPWLFTQEQVQGWLFYKARDFMSGATTWEAAAKAYAEGAAKIRAGGRP